MEVHRDTPSELAAQFTEQRQRVLTGGTAQAPTATPDAVPQLSALLSSSLEELRVAEEELVQQNDELVSGRAELERQLRHYRALFDLAPVALLYSDAQGVIREANRAAAALVDREARHLARKPLASLVPRTRRAAFREGLSRLRLTGGAAVWRFALTRGTASIEVSAAVQLVSDTTLGTALLWLLRPVASPEMP
jgi:PAS domain S-box-containing protein